MSSFVLQNTLCHLYAYCKGVYSARIIGFFGISGVPQGAKKPKIGSHLSSICPIALIHPSSREIMYAIWAAILTNRCFLLDYMCYSSNNGPFFLIICVI